MNKHYLHDEHVDPMELSDYPVDASDVIYELELLFDAVAFNNAIFAVEDEANVREVML